MVYNRCIGTRTCASYCPYKVRRFNLHDYRALPKTSHSVKNPDVTVRARGVMEKCSYCMQRIEAAHVQADKERPKHPRGEVATACQQACPTTGDHFRRHQERRIGGREAPPERTPLRASGRTRHAAAHHLSCALE